eukprot:12111-Heterococcus_DN1.PRE.1
MHKSFCNGEHPSTAVVVAAGTAAVSHSHVMCYALVQCGTHIAVESSGRTKQQVSVVNICATGTLLM